MVSTRWALRSETERPLESVCDNHSTDSAIPVRTAYQYRLQPTDEQRCQISRWLDRLRKLYNDFLADRFDWWEMNRCPVNACPLVASIAEPREQPTYYSQKRSL
ncbi:MAG: helix-turn-helix domain-containing protein, partial [Thermosynechococcus sp.]